MISLALLGKNIQQSKSKKVYENLLGEKIDYKLIDCVTPQEIPSLDTIFASKIEGLSITAPYKRIFLKEVSVGPAVASLQAINCLCQKKGKYFATNTDYFAIIEIFDQMMERDKFNEVVILGDGAMSLVTQKIMLQKKIATTVYSRKKNGDISQLDLSNLHSKKTLVINSCLKDFLFCGQLSFQSLFWDYNYDNERQRQKVPAYMDGLELLERQARLALKFWEIKSSN
ncbi:MAG: hypothetical protein A2504_06100 [Bdellovibrionales bacterium RIFOXYD12_FULL_39_22]|nr:MAG: hypothetical protein A2385_08420 [Bdellovibrionales bacterium RIFOXYB1_FULL_39_21]OFZ45273.1 MAG: hypothetical protein A2485_06115 [Bdellovibrionales bacterium RIFOXYC12_FULL_39_17]OFZ45537.1 MAG: hypothetical protein A2404_03000 [Bdellovibrionales bacterium RIFOXYC1_FULL_39_130]OFZ68306.1 MAG: hypothetical protein A2451_09295 [Bdellovibrionales bacterium RIFOXYC2_FULL_39_8]OFZ77398.1 MAG: hypothetical protein A2560_08590 [Bdellovibrionales bacterium RIFOXYD1_FULL_39_84]OFZ91527.1 MAG: